MILPGKIVRSHGFQPMALEIRLWEHKKRKEETQEAQIDQRVSLCILSLSCAFCVPRLHHFPNPLLAINRPVHSPCSFASLSSVSPVRRKTFHSSRDLAPSDR